MTRELLYANPQMACFNQNQTLESRDHKVDTGDTSGKISQTYNQSDLNSNRKVLFEQNYLESDSKQALWDRPDHSHVMRGVTPDPRDLDVYGGGQDHGNQLENFESFSKNYLTFKNVQKENQPPRGEYIMADTNRSASKDRGKERQEQPLTRHNDADRYLMMMKNRRKSSQPRQDSQNKSGKKKSSVFDEIRHQAVSRVHGRHF